MVEQEGKGGVPGLSLLAFFSSFLVHISVVILVAEGSARSKSEGEIIDHHRQKKICLFLFIYFLLWSRRNKGKREVFSLRLLAFLAFSSAHKCYVSVCIRICEIEEGRRNFLSSQKNYFVVFSFLLSRKKGKGGKEAVDLRVL